MKELLIRWDELPRGDLDALASDPVQGPRLAHLRAAEAWLASQSERADDCPSPEELYDYGRGPGYLGLSAAHKAEIERRFAECSLSGRCDCASLIESLAATPPNPVDFREGVPDYLPDPALLEPAEAGPAGRPQRRFGRRPVRRGRWMPMAAAAAVLVVGTVLFRGGGVGAGEGLPEYPLLRGAAEEALLFPRGPVLAGKPGHAPVFADAPLFELTPVAGAGLYEIVLRRHAGDAFSAGTEVARLRGENPILSLEAALEPDHYTWEAWAEVDGLLRHLGERDFEVARDQGLWIDLNGLDPATRVRALHRRGFFTDARHEARALPPSPERDAYLNSTPGR